MKGSVFKRGKTWTYTVDIGKDPITNKRMRKSVGGFKTRAQAYTALTIFLGNANTNTTLVKSVVYFNDFFPLWFEEYKKEPSMKASTKYARKFQASKLTEYFEGVALKDITSEMYEGFLNHLSSKYSKNTCKAIHAFSTMIFQSAVNMNIISKSPVESSCESKIQIKENM